MKILGKIKLNKNNVLKLNVETQKYWWSTCQKQNFWENLKDILSVLDFVSTILSLLIKNYKNRVRGSTFKKEMLFLEGDASDQT